jgi:hypothetical protein
MGMWVGAKILGEIISLPVCVGLMSSDVHLCATHPCHLQANNFSIIFMGVSQDYFAIAYFTIG